VFKEREEDLLVTGGMAQSSIDSLAFGNAAFVNEDYEEAHRHYSAAVEGLVKSEGEDSGHLRSKRTQQIPLCRALTKSFNYFLHHCCGSSLNVNGVKGLTSDFFF
jgi:hypothetical protein